MDFRKAYSFPLKNFHGMIFTSDNNKAIDFAQDWVYKNPLRVSKESEVKIISIINGDDLKMTTDLKLKYDKSEGIIYSLAKGILQPFIVIRGWGRLTGIGGLNLPDDVAYQLQDDFANHIVKSITDAYQPLDKSA